MVVDELVARPGSPRRRVQDDVILLPRSTRCAREGAGSNRSAKYCVSLATSPSEYHDAHRIRWYAVIGKYEFSDPEIAAADNSPDRKTLLVRLEAGLPARSAARQPRATIYR